MSAASGPGKRKSKRKPKTGTYVNPEQTRGRPRFARESMTEYVGIRMTTEQMQALQAEAQRLGVSGADVIRRALDDYFARSKGA